MSTTLERPPTGALSGNGGAPARRAMLRWAWRLFRREWRQQLLIVALVVVAVGATVLGATVATNTPPPANAGFGTAQDLATFQGPNPKLPAQTAALRHRFGRVEVIEDEVMTVPGSIDTYDLRAQDPHGPFGQPMLALVAGHYPTGPGQVAVTDGVASDFRLKIGDLWHKPGGTPRRVVGIVENPQSLLDEFALVVPGQVKAPTQVTLLFDAGGVRWGASRCWRSDGFARSGWSGPWAPPTSTSVLSCGPTASWRVSSAPLSERHWAWWSGWPTDRVSSRVPTT